MTSAYVLILAVLVLGGLLATLGDRLGTKVGKARLSLFHLRPRQTATVVTIITGIFISASTLGILFATSKSLRVGIFKLDEKLKELRQARQELTNVTEQKTQVEQALAEAKTEQIQAQEQLNAINQYLQEAINRQTATAAKLNQAETKLSQTQTEFQRVKTQLSLIESQYQRAQSQLDTFSEQAQTLRQEIQQLQTERQELLRQTEEVKAQIARRDREIAKRQQEIEQRDAEITQQQSQIAEQEAEITEKQNQISEQEAQIVQQQQEIQQQQELIARRQAEIANRDRVIAEREKLLEELERKQAFLERDIQNLELNFQFLREGNFAILRNQVLASGVVRILKPSGSRQAAEQLLREANLAAIERIRPGTNAAQEQVVQITSTEFERLVDEINDGQAYVVRILSSANYLVGENIVQVFADAALNKIIFFRGEVLAGTSVSPATMTEEALRERIDLLLASASFRARRAGILADTIEIAAGRLTVFEFIEQLQQYNREVIVQAIASDVTYTAGPLKINLVVIENEDMTQDQSP